MEENFRNKKHNFYCSQTWKKLRDQFAIEHHYICDICHKPLGYREYNIHHKKRITPYNIDDPNVTLNKENLMCLCVDCHNKLHEHDELHRSPEEDDEWNQLIFEIKQMSNIDVSNIRRNRKTRKQSKKQRTMIYDNDGNLIFLSDDENLIT